MKKILGLIVLFFSLNVMGQGSIGIKTDAPHSSSGLDISVDNKGLLIPRLTQGERDNILLPANSLLIFNTTSECFESYSTSQNNWIKMSCFTSCILPEKPDSIFGQKQVCAHQTSVNYFVAPVPNAFIYTWSFPSGTQILSGQGTQSVIVNMGAVGGVASVFVSNACGNSISAELNLTVESTPVLSGSISGDNDICALQANNLFSISASPDADSYFWIVPNDATIVLGQGTNSIQVNFGLNDGNISVSGINDCGSSPSVVKSINVHDVPAAPSSISGNFLVCSNQINGLMYTIPAAVDADSYTWTVPSGANILSGQGSTSIVVDFGISGGTISVQANNSCGSSSATTSIVVILPVPTTPSSVVGSNTVCAGQQGAVFTVVNDPTITTYTWSVPNGSNLISGQGTNTIEVDIGSNSGNISVIAFNSCGSSIASTLWVNVLEAPIIIGAITGNTTVCAGQTGVMYSVVSVMNATTYNWVVPSGANITSGQGTNEIAVDFGVNGGVISVTASNVCGVSGANTLNVSISGSPPPVSIGAITASFGATSVCKGQAVQFSVPFLSVISTYTWQISSQGTINFGQGTRVINVDIAPSATGNFTISVFGANNCGSSGISILTLPIIGVPETPGIITGSDSVCSGQTGVLYSVVPVPNATHYWSAPSWANVVSGQGTTNATIDVNNFTGPIQNRDILVRAANTCGSSAFSSLNVTITPIPQAPNPLNATNITETEFTANWSSAALADSYILDVATEPSFTLMVNGFSNLNVGNVLSFPVNNLTCGSNYFYRVTAVNSCGVSNNNVFAPKFVSTSACCANSCFFTEHYSFGGVGWTKSPQSTGFDIFVNNRAVFNGPNADNTLDRRIFKPLSCTLADCAWKADFIFSVTGHNQASAPILAFTAGTQTLLFDRNANPIAQTNQDAIIVWLSSFFDSNPLSLSIWAKDGTSQTASVFLSPPVKIDISFGLIYYCRLERTSPTNIKLSVFLDPQRTALISAPIQFTIPSTITGLNTIQHSNHWSGTNQWFQGWVDETIIF